MPRNFTRKFFHSLLLAGPLLAGSAFAADYTQAAGSTLGFSGKYQGEAFNGQFPGFVTTLSFDPAKLTGAKLDVTIPLATATTRNADYDSELRGESFFNSRKFAQARYTAARFRALGGNKDAAAALLNLRGIRKPFALPFTWSPKATQDRTAFGVGGGDWADVGVIPNEIKVTTKVFLQSK